MSFEGHPRAVTGKPCDLDGERNCTVVSTSISSLPDVEVNVGVEVEYIGPHLKQVVSLTALDFAFCGTSPSTGLC